MTVLTICGEPHWTLSRRRGLGHSMKRLQDGVVPLYLYARPSSRSVRFHIRTPLPVQSNGGLVHPFARERDHLRWIAHVSYDACLVSLEQRVYNTVGARSFVTDILHKLQQ